MPFLRRLDWVVGWYFLHFSHQAGVTCSGQRLEHRISPNVSFCLSVDCSGYTRLQSRSRLSEVVFVWHLEHLVTGMYKFPHNLIFFPTPIFYFFSKMSVPSLFFSTWYSSQQPKYYGKDYITSPFPFYHVIFFISAMSFPSPLDILPKYTRVVPDTDLAGYPAK